MNDRKEVYEEILKAHCYGLLHVTYEGILKAMDEAYFYGYRKGYNQGYSDAKQQEPDFNV